MKQFCALPSELRGDPGRLRGGGALRCFVCWAAVCATAQAGRGSVHLPHCYHYHNGATLLHTENTIIDSCQIIRFRWSPTIHWLLTSYSILTTRACLHNLYRFQYWNVLPSVSIFLLWPPSCQALTQQSPLGIRVTTSSLLKRTKSISSCVTYGPVCLGLRVQRIHWRRKKVVYIF